MKTSRPDDMPPLGSMTTTPGIIATLQRKNKNKQ